MNKLKSVFSLALFATIISCNQNQNNKVEKENELLKKENELLKKEQELNSKDNLNSKDSKVSIKTNDTWKIFHHKYGFSIELPDYFSEGALTASGIQYYINDLNENINVTVETMGEGSTSSLMKDYQSTINTSTGCDYKVYKNNWFVVSGQDENGIYYFKTIIKNGQTHYLAIHYPQSQKEIFDIILPRISKSFK